MIAPSELDAYHASWILSDPAYFKEYRRRFRGPRVLLAIQKAILDESGAVTAYHARAAYLYARTVIQDRWEEGERVILEATRLVQDHSDEACTTVVEAAESYREFAFGPEAWPELVQKIRSGQCHPYFIIEYGFRSSLNLKATVAEGLLNTPVFDEDKAVEREKRRQLAYSAEQYAAYVIKGRWDEGENLLSGCTYCMFQYAQCTLKYPLPARLHSEMVMKSFENPDDRHIKDYFKWCDEWAAAARGGAP